MLGTVMINDNPDNHKSIDDFQMTILQATGDTAVIEQLQSCQAMKNLGLYALPEGGTEPQFSAARNRVDDWTINLKNSHLPTRSAWLSYNCQLWSGLKYGIGALPTKLEDLMNALGTMDHKILSMLGICRNITMEWRYLPSCYGGMGLNNLPIKATAASLNAFLQHYGTNTSIGIYLTASIENLQLKMGVAGCLFDYNYEIWHELATDSWVKSL